MYKPPAQPNQSLQNGIACLLELASSGRPVGVQEMARTLGLERTRVSRLLGTLAYLGLTQRRPDRKFVPGPGLHVLAALSLRSSRLLVCALPRLQRLIETCGERVNMGVLWRTEVCYLFRGSPQIDIESSIAPQDLWKAEGTSIGRVLMAEMPFESVRARYEQRVDGSRLSEAELDTLLGQLRLAQKQGYDVAPLPQRDSIAVPVGSPALASVAIHATDSIPTEAIPRFVGWLKETAEGIDRDMRASKIGEQGT